MGLTYEVRGGLQSVASERVDNSEDARFLHIPHNIECGCLLYGIEFEILKELLQLLRVISIIGIEQHCPSVVHDRRTDRTGFPIGIAKNDYQGREG